MKTYDKKLNNTVQFLDDIFEKTGIKVTLYDKDNKPILDELTLVETVDINTKIYKSEKENKTYFQLDYNGDIFTCSILGSSDDIVKQALLICSLFYSSAIKIDDLSIEDIYKSLLFGEIDSNDYTRVCERITFPEKPSLCYLITLSNGKIEDAKGVLQTYIEKYDKVICLSNDKIALIKFMEVAEDEYRSTTEFASSLIRTIYEETGINTQIYIGGIFRRIYDLSISYGQATNTLRICLALNEKGNVHNYKEYIFYKLLEDLPKYKLKEYLDSLLDYTSEKLFNDSEMVETAESFLENNLNISETSRKLYLHRNTLSYRLDKIEKETGLDIRKFSDALSFRFIMVLKGMLK